MNTVISVYTAKAYKEFVLPNINNSNYSVILEKDVYSLSKDIVINFDIIENDSLRVEALDNLRYDKNPLLEMLNIE